MVSRVHLVHVFPHELDLAKRAQLIGQLRLYVNEKAASLGGLEGVQVGVHIRVGFPAPEIARLAADVTANLIVIGAKKGLHVRSWLLGSVSESLLAWARCPVLVAGPQPPPVHHEPEIEPPCPDCLRARAEWGGARFWCARHAHEAARAHVFSYRSEIPFASHDSEVIPTGVDA